MRAVVTGGAGFIGSHLVDALVARGDEVTVLDNLSTGSREVVNAEARFREHDVREGFYEPADVIFHLAAQGNIGVSVEQPGFDAEVNVVGTIRVLEAAREANARVVFASSGGAIHGESERAASEDDPPQPFTPYGAAKLAAEGYLATWNRLHGSVHSSLRFSNVYGPRQRAGLEGGVVAIFLDRLRAGEETVIYGDGGQTRDFVYVGDVVDAMLAAASRDGGGVYEIATGTATTIRELHRLCVEAAGVDREPRLVEQRAGDVRHSVLDPGRAARELGWRAETSLADGLRRTWDTG